MVRSDGICLIGCSFDVTLGPDGQGIFTGVRRVAVLGDRRFQASPDQVSSFAGTLAPLRPKGKRNVLPGRPGCTNPSTEGDTVEIRWQGAGGPAGSLRYYTGCDRSPHGRTERALVSAPYRLPIPDLIGRPDPTR